MFEAREIRPLQSTLSLELELQQAPHKQIGSYVVVSLGQRTTPTQAGALVVRCKCTRYVEREREIERELST